MAAFTRLRLAALASGWDQTPVTSSQIALAGVLDAAPFSQPAGDLDTGAIAAALRQRLHRAPVLSRRIVWSRLGEGRPAWTEDPAFDPARHISTVRLPPGADLFDWCAGRAARPLDLARPPWRIEIVDGLPGPSFGLLVVVHHVLDVLADGLTGMAIAASLLDASPDADAGQVPPRPGSPLPGHRDLVGDNLLAQASAIGRAAHQVASAAHQIPSAAHRIPSAAHQVPSAAHKVPRAGQESNGRQDSRAWRSAWDAADFRVNAPVTSLSHHAGPGRHLAVVRWDLDTLRVNSRSLGASVNDMLLTAVTAGLRQLLVQRGDDVRGLSLRASMPMAAPDGSAEALLLGSLPVGESSLREQLSIICKTTARLKTRHAAGSGEVLGVLHLPALVARLSVNWLRHAARHKFNLYVTSVPGRATPFWLAGARLRAAVPIPPLVGELPLAVAALSYAGVLTVSINSDAAVGDLAPLVSGMHDALSTLLPDAVLDPPVTE